jgi:predicted amidophosphoribosyltransferase
MPAFCSSCGAKTSISDRFCGSCGSTLVDLCPTCGQEWNGVEVERAPVSIKPTPAKKVVSVPKTGVEVSKPEAPPNVRLTSAAVDPIYGASFNYKNDCPNCGAKGQKNQPCKTCGFDQ